MKRLFVCLTLLMVLAACGQQPGDRTAPTVEVQLSGTLQETGVYENEVTVTIAATDADDSEVSVAYSLSGGAFRAYSAPFTIDTPGSYTLSARAADKAGNVATTQETSFHVVTKAPVLPALEIQLSGVEASPGVYSDQVTVTITARDEEGGSGVAASSYRLNDGAFLPYSEPFGITTEGEYTLTAQATDGAGNTATAERSFRVVLTPPSEAKIELENLDGMVKGELQAGFFNDWLVFSRIADTSGTPPANSDWTILKYHDVATLRIKNISAVDTLRIAGLTISDSSMFILPDKEDEALPLEIAPNSFYDLAIQFVETTGSKGVRRGTLTIQANDVTEPTTVVNLAGAFMTQPESKRELSIQQIADVMGYKIAIGRPLPLSEKPDSPLAGDEVRSNLWVRANPSKAVYVRQLAAYHGCCNTQDLIEVINPRDGSVTGSFRHAKAYGQSMLPPISGTSGKPAEMVLSPATPFEVRIAGYSSYPAQKTNGGNLAVRFWPVRDRDGVLIPDSYFVGQDYVLSGCGTGGANCDFQDNVYLITNIKPYEAQYRLNVAGPAYTDKNGNAWLPDKATGLSELFSPAGAISEPKDKSNPHAIAGTDDDTLYQSYRALLPGNPPQDQRVLSFALPIGPGRYTVRLHFAELYWNDPGKRVFEVIIEDTPVLTDFDILEETARATALVKTFSGIQVSDGYLDVSFRAKADYGAISALEVIRAPGD